MTSFHDSEKIKYVEKLENLANVPEARPIEDFWADLYNKSSKKSNQYLLMLKIQCCMQIEICFLILIVNKIQSSWI